MRGALLALVAALLLAACAGAYVAGDVGGHHADDKAQVAPR